jgi:hypothetical protein
MAVTTATLTSSDQVVLANTMDAIASRLMLRSLGGPSRATTFTITSDTSGTITFTYTDGNGTISQSIAASVA